MQGHFQPWPLRPGQVYSPPPYWQPRYISRTAFINPAMHGLCNAQIRHLEQVPRLFFWGRDL